MQFLKSLGCLALLTFLSGCGANGIVQNISVESNVDANNEQIVSVETYLNLGSLKLPSLTLPIPDPKNSSQQIGAIVLSNTVDGFNVIALEANASKILAGQISSAATLPNGNSLPLSNSAGVATINLSGVSKLYLGGGSAPFVGFALVIPEFDVLGSYVSGYSLFLPLASNLGVSGLAGVFSGGKSQNGLGLFVSIPTGSAATSTKTLAAKAQPDTLTFIATDESSSKSKKLKSVLSNLSQKKTQLRVR